LHNLLYACSLSIRLYVLCFVNCLSFLCKLSLTVRRELVRSTWRDEEYVQAPACRSSSLNKCDSKQKKTAGDKLASGYSLWVAQQPNIIGCAQESRLLPSVSGACLPSGLWSRSRKEFQPKESESQKILTTATPGRPFAHQLWLVCATNIHRHHTWQFKQLDASTRDDHG